MQRLFDASLQVKLLIMLALSTMKQTVSVSKLTPEKFNLIAWDLSMLPPCKDYLTQALTGKITENIGPFHHETDSLCL